MILTKNGPMFRDLGVKNGTHVYGFFVKNRPIWAAHPRTAFLWKYPPPGYITWSSVNVNRDTVNDFSLIGRFEIFESNIHDTRLMHEQ